MRTKTHMLIGLTSGVACGLITLNAPMLTTFITCMVLIESSTIPDYDIKLHIEHRGFTHSILFGLIIAILIFFIYPSILSAFLLGFYLHLLADIVTNSGVQLFYPVKIKISLPLLGYDSAVEIIIQTCCYLIMGILFWIQVPVYYKSFLYELLNNTI